MCVCVRVCVGGEESVSVRGRGVVDLRKSEPPKPLLTRLPLEGARTPNLHVACKKTQIFKNFLYRDKLIILRNLPNSG
jgi:hypothetical protein